MLLFCSISLALLLSLSFLLSFSLSLFVSLFGSLSVCLCLFLHISLSNRLTWNQVSDIRIFLNKVTWFRVERLTRSVELQSSCRIGNLSCTFLHHYNNAIRVTRLSFVCCCQALVRHFINRFVCEHLYCTYSEPVMFQAAATPANPLSFQTDYLQLRSKLIQSFVLVVQACSSFQTSPPPAIATSLTVTTGLERHRCEHVLVQARVVQNLEFMVQRWGLLFRDQLRDIRVLGSGISVPWV